MLHRLLFLFMLGRRASENLPDLRVLPFPRVALVEDALHVGVQQLMKEKKPLLLFFRVSRARSFVQAAAQVAVHRMVVRNFLFGRNVHRALARVFG